MTQFLGSVRSSPVINSFLKRREFSLEHKPNVFSVACVQLCDCFVLSSERLTGPVKMRENIKTCWKQMIWRNKWKSTRAETLRRHCLPGSRQAADFILVIFHFFGWFATCLQIYAHLQFHLTSPCHPQQNISNKIFRVCVWDVPFTGFESPSTKSELPKHIWLKRPIILATVFFCTRVWHLFIFSSSRAQSKCQRESSWPDELHDASARPT